MSPEEEAKLKQFDVLWAEIARRSNAQQALVAATVTITGTVSGLVVTEGANSVLLVVLAIVSPVFGLLWVDHARNIGVIGNFICCNWHWKPNWEKHSAKDKRGEEGAFRFVIFMIALTIVFFVPAVVGLVASVGHLGDPVSWVAWAGALVLTILFLICWIIQIYDTRPGSPDPCLDDR